MTHRFTFAAMASVCELRVDDADEALAGAAAAAAIGEVRRIEAKYSRYRADSVVSRLNAAAGAEPVAVDDETAGLVAYADACFRESGGAFDVTSGVLRRAWDFRRATLPDADAVRALLPLVGWDKVDWQSPQLFLPMPGMEIDFGGIAKEYAADCAAAACLAEGARHALVNLGGDIRVTGPRADGSPWHIAIREPRAPGRALHEAELSSGGLATSGDYERFFEVDGRRYCHILDPRTGWPAEHVPRSVSVAAPACIVAGSVATMAMLAGVGAARLLADSGLPWLLVDADGGVAGGLSAEAPML